MSTDAAINSVIDAKASQTQQQIGFALAAKALNAQRQQGDAAIELVEAAGQLGKALGRGQNFDAVS